MIEKIKNTIKKYDLVKKNEVVVVGLSGGPDSTALTVALAQIAPLIGINLIIAHFNHGLRGRESNADELFAGKLAKQLGLSFISQKMSKTTVPRGFSPEDYYRRQRYLFFAETADRNKADKIALGHNMQDQAETVLLHLLRGSGLDGLQGIMPLRNGRYIRPLIEISRTEIIAFLELTGITYRQDSTNNSKHHLRNKIRLELLPYLKREFNPRMEESLAQMAGILREDNNFIKENLHRELESPFITRKKSKISLNIEYLSALPIAIQRRLIKELLEDFSSQKNGITFRNINSVAGLLENPESGKVICLPFGVKARREYENLILELTESIPEQIRYLYKVEIPGVIYIAERNLTVNLQVVAKNKIDISIRNKNYFDLDKIQFPLVLRNRREGDWFKPLGMSGRKKLKSFFIDQKIAQQKRDEIILLVDQKSVLWIEGMHMDDDVKITTGTKNVLELEII